MYNNERNFRTIITIPEKVIRNEPEKTCYCKINAFTHNQKRIDKNV